MPTPPKDGNADDSAREEQVAELDLTKSEVDVVPTGLIRVQEKPYDPEPGRDQARLWITLWLLGLLTLLVLVTFAALVLIPGVLTFENLKNILEILLSPLIVLVSAATGFYFGAKSAQPPPG